MAKTAKKEEKTVLDEITLLEVFEELDDVIESMEEDNISLEETFQLYHKGMDLLKVCNDKIDNVEKKILVLDEDGEKHEFE